MMIDLYNETAANSRNVRLTNRVETLTDVGWVDLALPSGSIRLKTSTYATHIFCEVDGQSWILEITSRRCMGGNLWELSYTVDYLKDFWDKYAGYTINSKIVRSTNTSYRNPWQPDELVPLTGQATRTVTQSAVGLPHFADVLDGRTILAHFMDGTSGTPYILVMDRATWFNIQTDMYKTTDAGEALSQSFIGAWFLPTKNLPTTGALAVTTLNLVKDDTTYPYTIPIPVGGMTVFDFRTYSGGGLYEIFTTNLSIPYSDWQDYTLKRYSLYIPYIGVMPIDPKTIHGALFIQYRYDLTSATLQAVVKTSSGDDTNNGLSPSVALPQMPNIRNTANREQRQIITSTAANVLATGASAALGGAMLGSAGGPVGAGAGAALGALSGIVGAVIGGAANYQTATYGAAQVFTGAGGWMGNYWNRPALEIIVYSTRISPSVIGASYGYPAEYAITALNNLSTGGHWLDMSSANIPGPSWYAENVRTVYHNKKIIV